MADNHGMLKGALIGGVLGAAAALLLAPKTGRELRGDIRDRYVDVQDRTKQILTDVGSKTQEVAKQVGQQASDIMDKTRSVVSAAKDGVQSWKDDIKAETIKEENKIN
jgi:gas vesicle protein